jgi:hypothetical protein
VEQRLAAAHRYLEVYPKGTYRDEVTRWFEKVEPAYYASARDSRKRLARYLQALPHGPHAERASRRMLELERGERGARKRDAQAIARAKRVQDDIQAAADARTAFVSTIGDWVRRVAAIRSWGGRTSDLDHEFIHAYRVQAPPAECDASSCIKRLEISYAVPHGGGLLTRNVRVAIVLTLADGGVVQAQISGVDLFSRIGEATGRVAFDTRDYQARAEGIAHSVRVLERALDSRMGQAGCRREPVSPIVLERLCSGIRARDCRRKGR